MRVALLSPYSWTYPGGVMRHVEALAGELLAAGHEVRVFAPVDPDHRRTALAHRGARPQARAVPEWLVPLGGTIGWPANGAVSNLSLTPSAVSTLRRELRAGAFDVVHLHEPVAPVVGWDTLTSCAAPLVGTFHCYSDAGIPHALGRFAGGARRLNRLGVRIAVSRAAAWTAERFWGGEYRIVPNGVALPPGGVPAPRERLPGQPLRIAFVGQAVERKGLPVLLAAFEALREHVPASLTVIGSDPGELAPLLVDTDGVRALGRASDRERHAALEAADVLCAPSLGGESFGMVLTEAFAAGTPVVASDIAGYRDVVRPGVEGRLVAPGDPVALAEALRDLALDPASTRAMGARAGERASRYAWPRVAQEVVGAYEDVRALPVPATAPARAAVRLGLRPADGGPPRPPRRLAPLEPSVRGAGAEGAPLDPPVRGADAGGHGRRRGPAARAPVPHRRWTPARRIGVGLAAVLAVVGSGVALERIGVRSVGEALVASSPPWVLVALALMSLSMVVRAVAWHAILRAALPEARPRFIDALQGTSIGVLMSATLPARLGEPARAWIVARRLGRPRERLPAVLGTLVSQTLLNVLALVILGGVMFATVGLFAGRQQALAWYAVAPFVVLCAVLVAPALLRSGRPSRSERVGGWLAQGRHALTRVRAGLRVFGRPRLGLLATGAQLGAWALQWLGCFVLLVALELDDQAGLGAAAAVLFAVNVSAVLPLTPSNLGVFQAACVAVLTGAYGIDAADALGYGIILQAVEVATAIVMGAPALVKEGLSWRDVRLSALRSTPVSLAARPGAEAPAKS